MSVITYHEVNSANGDIFKRLKDEGIIYPADLWSPKRSEYVHFDNVFDIKKCDRKAYDEYMVHYSKIEDRVVNDIRQNRGLSQREVEALIKNRNKREPHLMPVHESKSGGMAWALNYGSNDFPTVALGNKYPDEIFDYYQQTEGHLDVSCKFKNNKDCTADGQPYENLIVNIPSSQIREVNEDTLCVNLYVDSSDKRPAFLYVNKNDVKPFDYTESNSRTKDNKDIVIRDNSKPVTLYRTLSDGTKSKESWSVDDLKAARDKCYNEYRNKKAQERLKDVQPSAENETQTQLGE